MNRIPYFPVFARVYPVQSLSDLVSRHAHQVEVVRVGQVGDLFFLCSLFCIASFPDAMPAQRKAEGAGQS